MSETRASGRFKTVTAPNVALEFEDLSAGRGIVADISEGGACIITDVGLDVSLDVGAKVRLKLSLPNKRTVDTTGELRWIHEDPIDKSIRCGFQFEPGVWTDDRLRSLIATSAAD